MKIKHSIPYKQTSQFSQLILDYIDKGDFFRELIRDFPSLESLKSYAKSRVFDKNQRQITYSSIAGRYDSYGIQKPERLGSLLENNVFTITTGHQLNILTGPLYSILKIASVIKLCKQLEQEGLNVQPVFWLASEDHDFEEISHTKLYNQDLKWEAPANGAVGAIDPSSLNTVLDAAKLILGDRFDQNFYSQIEACYEVETLAEAHFRLIHLLFGAHDLIIIDADDSVLKSCFIPQMKKELESSLVRNSISVSNAHLAQIYKVQAHAREINLFYMAKDQRTRIVRLGDGFSTSNEKHKWRTPDLLAELENNPEKFSPNVLMRPIFQELILPNLAYVGGGGELAYWLQLKSVFESFDVQYPVLILRQSLGVLTAKEFSKLEKLNLEITDLFREKHVMELKLLEQAGADFNLDQEKVNSNSILKSIKTRVESIDMSLAPSVEGEMKKLEKSLDSIVSKVIKAQKRKMEVGLSQANGLKDKLLPNDKLQERQINFLQFYNEEFIADIIACCDPLCSEFQVIEA